MGFLGEEPVASISVVTYGERFGFLGFYICRSEFRGNGYGWAIWQTGLARLGERTVGLDGVLAQQDNYARSGFRFSRRNIRFGGTAAPSGISDRYVVEMGPSQHQPLAASIVEYDRGFFPGPREAFLRAWIAPPGRRTVAYMSGDAIRGYGCARMCRAGYKIGPLFADDEGIADRLFVALISPLSGKPIFLDVPEPNRAAMQLAERHGLAPVFETARMYRGAAPAEPLDRIFGITTFELG